MALIRTFAAISAAGLLAGCATMAQPKVSPPSEFCQVARPITWSRSDTRLTKEQADTHNRVGRKLCGWGKKK